MGFNSGFKGLNFFFQNQLHETTSHYATILATGQHQPAVCLRVACNFVVEVMDREEAHYVAN